MELGITWVIPAVSEMLTAEEREPSRAVLGNAGGPCGGLDITSQIHL